MPAGDAPNPKYIVREHRSPYKFVVSHDLGKDSQGGYWFKDLLFFTHRPAADAACKQLNENGVLYLPGTCAGCLV